MNIQEEQRPWSGVLQDQQAGQRAGGELARGEQPRRRWTEPGATSGAGAGHSTETGFTLGEKGSCWKVLNTI